MRVKMSTDDLEAALASPRASGTEIRVRVRNQTGGCAGGCSVQER